MPNLLHHTSYGSSESSGSPVVILHGLFGSSRNWGTVARKIAERQKTFALDLRNHGDSFHSDSHTIEDMVLDLRFWIDETLQGERPILLGHSMGGLVALFFALQFPSHVQGLFVVDIAPRAYRSNHRRQFEALKIDVSSMKTRQQVDEQMAKIETSPEVRSFLQMNLERDRDTGTFRWKINLEPLEKGAYLENIKVPESVYHGPTFFLFGSESPYYDPEDREKIEALFPSSQIQVLEGAGHWLFHSHRSDFLQKLDGWLQSENLIPGSSG